jgi:hypothetical protein
VIFRIFARIARQNEYFLQAGTRVRLSGKTINI